MKQEKKFVTYKYLKAIEESELDIEAVENVLGKNAYEEPGFERIFVNENKNGWSGEAERISIELLRKTIDKLEKTGANYVEVFHHTDHNGYVFYGLEVRKSTPEEIEDEKRKELAGERIKKRLSELKSEAVELQKQYEKL